MIAKVLYRELKGTPLSIVDVGASGGLDKRWSAYDSFCKAVISSQMIEQLFRSRQIELLSLM